MSQTTSAGGWTLRAVHEWCAHDPFGGGKPSDLAAGQAPSVRDEGGVVFLSAPRNGYASFRLLVQGRGEYRLRTSIEAGLALDLYKAWYHRMKMEDGGREAYWPDALAPVRPGAAFQLPDPENAVDGQTTQEFWVDIFVPPDADPGPAAGGIDLLAASGKIALPLRIEVLEAVVPDETCVVMDHNSYGSRWLHGFFPAVFGSAGGPKRVWEKTIELLHHYHRLVHEHRGHLSNLGYGHSGSVDPIYAPVLAGSGRGRQLDDWNLFDRHYGPLLDGSAFSKAAPAMPPPRRPAAPIWGVYTPVNPDWPASYLWWGEKGYEVEFERGVGQFDAHFREKGWTNSTVWFFFNHKKRYRWFEWDGDEPKYAKDDQYHLEMGRLLRKTIADSPVKWVYRMDASWQMKNEFERLAGAVDFWVLGGFSRWFPEEIRRVKQRGDIVWWYGGTPSIDKASSAILENVYKTWVRGLDGFCAWLTVNPGPDPWFDCDGSATGSIYPGERFGIPGPVPSIRLKIQRNGIQDIDLINRAAGRNGTLDALRDELARQIPIRLWDKPPKTVLELPPEDWDNNNLRTEIEPGTLPWESADPYWWNAIRRRAFPGR